MEDVLDVYHRPYDEKRPLVCLDEASKQLIGEVIEPIPAEPGQPERFDYEYTRNGTANLFMISEPLLGWRHVEVTQRRTAKDFVVVLRWLVEDLHPGRRQGRAGDGQPEHAQAGVAVQGVPALTGNGRIAEGWKFIATLKHGSWLNVAEIEPVSWPDSVWTAIGAAETLSLRSRGLGRSTQ